MKKARLLPNIIFTLIICFAGLTAVPAQAEETKSAQVPVQTQVPSLAIAVLPFEASAELTEAGAQVAAVINAELSAKGFSLVERAELDKVLSELELGQSGTVSEESAAKVGYLTGAKIIVTGRVFAVGDELTLFAKVIGTETGQVFAERVSLSIRESYVPASKELASRVAKIIEARKQNLLAKEKSNEEALEQLVALGQGKKLPAVMVDISESHAGQPALDSAAETEMNLVLGQVGFFLFTKDGPVQETKIKITGEASSDRAIRRGDMISCKARVEMKAVEIPSGRIIAVDRETQAAADVSEKIAGKTAIQKATQAIALRLIPKIIKTTYPGKK